MTSASNNQPFYNLARALTIALGAVLTIPILSACDSSPSYEQISPRSAYYHRHPSSPRVIFVGGVDSHYVHYLTGPPYEVVQGADSATFEVIEGVYARDSRHVYRRELILEGANPAAQITVMSPAHIIVGNRTYCAGNYDPSSPARCW